MGGDVNGGRVVESFGVVRHGHGSQNDSAQSHISFLGQSLKYSLIM